MVYGAFTDIKQYCGDPIMVDSYQKSEKVTLQNKELDVNCVIVDQWYYKYGQSKTTYIVEFEGGFVSRVRKGQSAP